jgi:group I intron endonuclease
MSEEQEKKWCVYIHRNMVNNKAYIGITQQKPERRWQNGYGYRNSPHFWNSIEKYGWDNFEHIIWCEGLTESEAFHIERLLIALFDTTNSDYGYNISFGGELSHYGISHSEEAKEKMSESQKRRFENPENHPMKGKNHTEESRMKMSIARKNPPRETREKMSRSHLVLYSDGFADMDDIFVYQYSTLGELIDKFFGVTWASEQTGISRTAIDNCLHRLSKTAGGYIWRYSYEELTEEDIIDVNTKKTYKRSGRKNKSQSYHEDRVKYAKWYDKQRGKWRTRFVYNNKSHSLGQYLTETEADIAIEKHKNYINT